MSGDGLDAKTGWAFSSGEVHEKLIRRVDVEGGCGLHLRAERRSSLLPDSLGGLATFREGIGSQELVLRLRPEDESTTLPDRLVAAVRAFLHLHVRDSVEATECGMFHPFRDVLGKIGSVGDAAHALDIHTFGRDKGRPRPSRLNRDLDNSSAPRIVSAPKNFDVHMGPEPPNEGQEDPSEVVDWR